MFDNSLNRGIIYMLFASLMFAVMGAAAKLLSNSLNSVEIVFFRNLIGTALVVASFWSHPLVQTGGKPLLLLFRGLAGTVALFAVFYNVAHIPLGEVVTYVQTAPIFIAVFAWLFLKERLSSRAWVGVAIGFAGIVLIAKPSGEMFQKTDLLGIFSGVFAALAYTSIRELKSYYDNRTIVLSFMLSGTLLPMLGMLAYDHVSLPVIDFMIAPFVVPSGMDWFWIAIVALSATLGQLYITKAYGASKAGIIATVGYSNILFAIGIGWLIGDSMLDSLTWMGIALVVLSGVLAAGEKTASPTREQPAG